MNRKDRKELERAFSLVEQAREIIDTLGEAEQEKFDNLSEGLQEAERGQKLQENADSLMDLSGELESNTETIQNLIEG